MSGQRIGELRHEYSCGVIAAERIAELEYNLGMSRGNVYDLRKIRDEKDKRIAFLESEVEKYLAMTRSEKTEYHKMAERIAELEYNLGMSRGNVDDLRKIRDEKDKRIAFLESEVEKYQAMTRREKTEYHKMAERIEG